MLFSANQGPVNQDGTVQREVQRPKVVVWRETWRDIADEAVPNEQYPSSR